MKTVKIYIGCLFLFIMGLNACDPDVEIDNPDQYKKVYMPVAVNNPVEKTFVFSDNIDTLIYGANFGGPGDNEYNINVKFKVDESLVASYNHENNTSFELLPAEAYELETTEAVIPKGQMQTEPLYLKIHTNNIPGLKRYILPLTIASQDSPYQLNEEISTTYFIINATYLTNPFENIDRANWEIAGFSDQESEGEGPNNGRAIFAIDEDENTFWHTQYKPSAIEPPHFITVDTKEAQVFHGFTLRGRPGFGSGNPHILHIDVSNDGNNWTVAGEYSLQNTTENTFYLSEFLQGRYFKITITEAHNNTPFTYLTDIQAF